MVHRRALAAILPALALLGGCAGAADPPGSEEGYVLLDRAAREALTLSADGWEGKPILPMAIGASAEVALKTANGRATPIDLSPGMLAYVHGGEGKIERLEVGHEARPDRLLLHGDEPSARAMALLLGASATERGDGLWNLTAPDIFTKTSYLNEPEGLLEAMPDVALDTGDIDAPEPSAPAILGLDGAARGEDIEGAGPGRREALFVGVYTSGASALLLDASGRFSRTDRCSGEVTREGHYYVLGGRVVLQSRGAPPRALAIETDCLLDTSGERLQVLEPAWALLQKRGEP